MPRTQLEWMRTVAVGDVLQERAGPMRVVREVSRYDNGDLRAVTLAIRRCSWTGRPYTVLGYTDLRVRGFRRVAHLRSPLRRPLDLKIQAAIRQEAKPYAASCCDVRGIA